VKPTSRKTTAGLPREFSKRAIVLDMLKAEGAARLWPSCASLLSWR
jgi:hypothetical protein